VDLKIIRDGKGRSVEVELGERNATLATGGYRNYTTPMDRDGLNGVTVDDLTGRLRDEMEIPDDLDGAYVTEVERDSNAFRAGLRPGDVIVEIDRDPVDSAEEAVTLSTRAQESQILLRVWSRGDGRPGLRYLVVDNTRD
jgi:serine protease Do